MMKSELFFSFLLQELSVISINCRDPSDEESKARKIVRSNNFTQQTNALDVDKHMSVIYVLLLIY